MNLNLKNKVVLITGASRGIGKAIALGFAAEGARLSICGRTPATLESAASEIKRLEPKCSPSQPTSPKAPRLKRW